MNAKEKTQHVTKKAVALIKVLHNPPVGAVEFSGGWCKERCDALLFTSCSSFLIETKVSRSDFKAGMKKSFRVNPKEGVGKYRYYACPTGLIKPDELPEKWGLIYVDCDKTRARAQMPRGYGGHIRNPRKDEKHPTEGWRTKTGFDEFGCGRDSYVDYRFLSNDALERQYLFALATRYKKQQFMDNIL